MRAHLLCRRHLFNNGWPFGHHGILFAGAAALALAMGIGRFAYTPLLPMMKSATHLTTGYASLLASLNYVGYLVGAVVSRHPFFVRRRAVFLTVGTVLSTATTFAMAFTGNHVLWAAIRLLSGIASAFVFVYASAIVLDAAAAFEQPRWNGMLYSGVGVGILLSAVTIGAIRNTVSWSQAWIIMGCLSTPLLILSLGTLQPFSAPALQSLVQSSASRWRFYALLGAYFAEGIGYIVPATFIVLFIASSRTLHAYSDMTWAIVGATAIPSTILWNSMSRKWNRYSVTTLAMLIQAVGVAAPVFEPNAVGALLAAATLGVTFVGISSLVLGAARDISPYGSSATIALFTVVFGVGQILGPLMVAEVVRIRGGYDAALLLAAGLLMLGAAALGILSLVRRACSIS